MCSGLIIGVVNLIPAQCQREPGCDAAALSLSLELDSVRPPDFISVITLIIMELFISKMRKLKGVERSLS